ncbi:MAG: hypothetical protein QOI12_2548 [Alphaproteobacteria bacterium]|jgi:hypothetical protein|nr:hypothetical protein [Alphaproteobacteria bacterium]
MHLPIAGAAAALLISTGVALAAPAAPAGRLAPKDIQAMFFTGTPFTASTPANVKFKMVFMPDGKMTREPAGATGSKNEGTWKLSQDGFCTTWKGSKQNCFRVQASGDNKWSVIASTQAVAYWSK